jgi:GT2 family glycosyltransferase
MEEIQSTPQTSILVVARNQADLVRRTLESIGHAADPASLEAIIVDNASNDGTESSDTDFPSVKMLRMQRNFGWTKAVNVGTRTAKGRYLCLTPPGIEFASDTIPRLVAALDADSTALAVCPLTMDSQGTPVTRIYPLPTAETFRQFWRTGSLGKPLTMDLTAPSLCAPYVTGTPLLMRRQSIVGMNYLDERYGQFWSDAEICFQIARAGKGIVVHPDIKVTGVQPYLPIPEKLDKWAAKLSADAALGAAAYLSKHSGFGTGLGFRISAVFSALGGLLTFRRPGAQMVRFWNVLSGQKIDGTHGA